MADPRFDSLSVVPRLRNRLDNLQSERHPEAVGYTLNTRNESESQGAVLTGYARVSTTRRRHDRYGQTPAGSQPTLVVWKLDRLGRSVKDLVDLVTDVEFCGVGFRSLRVPASALPSSTRPAS